jgi:hypothetical protein
LSPGDERKGQSVVAEAQHRQSADSLAAPGKRDAENRRARPKDRRREADTQRHQRQRRDFFDGDADKDV